MNIEDSDPDEKMSQLVRSKSGLVIVVVLDQSFTPNTVEVRTCENHSYARGLVAGIDDYGSERWAGIWPEDVDIEEHDPDDVTLMRNAVRPYL